MGQQITVTPKKSSKPGVAVFELNRSLTGMGHERYRSPDIPGRRPPDELARRLFAVEGVRGVHVYSNVVTVEIGQSARIGGGDDRLVEVIRDLFTYYREGVEVVDPMAEVAG